MLAETLVENAENPTPDEVFLPAYEPAGAPEEFPPENLSPEPAAEISPDAPASFDTPPEIAPPDFLPPDPATLPMTDKNAADLPEIARSDDFTVSGMMPAVASPHGIPGAVQVITYAVATDPYVAESDGFPTEEDGPSMTPPDVAPPDFIPAAPATLPPTNYQADTMNTENPTQGDPAHKYVGRDSRGDVWQLFDPAQNRVLEWAVNPGEDSRNILTGTLRDIGAPSGMTVAQAGGTVNASAAIPTTTNQDTSAPAQSTNLPTSAPATALSRIVGDSRHKYVGTDSRGDVYQLYDPSSDRVLEWAVKINDDSRNMIAGSLRDLGAPSSATTAQRTDYQAPTTNNSNPSTTPSNATPGAVKTNQNTQTTAGGGQPRPTDARHKYVGRLSNGNDVWQLFDGSNIIEWQTLGGDESGNFIRETIKNLGAPSSATIAQNDGTKPGGPQSMTSQTISSTAGQTTTTATAAPGEKSAVLVWAGIAASLLSALK